MFEVFAEMSPFVFVWLVAVIVFLGVEISTVTLTSIWFAAGGLVTLLVTALAPELHLIWQLLIFVGVSVILLLCTRKICLKLLKNDNVKTNIDAIIGTIFTVKDISEEGYTYHTINGTSWRVQAIDGETLEAGRKFEICEIKGNKLIAKKVKE